MAGVEFPEDRQQAFVREHHFPRRFDEARALLADLGEERLLRQPLPRIEFEELVDGLLVGVGEAACFGKPDLFHVHQLDGFARLFGGLGEVGDGLAVLQVFPDTGEMDGVFGDQFPALDECFVDRVELIAGWKCGFEPLPLDDRCF